MIGEDVQGTTLGSGVVPLTVVDSGSKVSGDRRQVAAHRLVTVLVSESGLPQTCWWSRSREAPPSPPLLRLGGRGCVQEEGSGLPVYMRELVLNKPCSYLGYRS